jgi:hypothetical protein
MMITAISGDFTSAAILLAFCFGIAAIVFCSKKHIK